jgi:recombinational DNA repair ATPase RecF
VIILKTNLKRKNKKEVLKMNKKEYLKKLIMEKQNELMKEHNKAQDNLLKIDKELKETTCILTEKRFDFLKRFKEKNKKIIIDTLEEFDFTNEILKEYL